MQKQQLHTLVLGCKFMKICSMIVCFYKQQQQQQKNYYRTTVVKKYVKVYEKFLCNKCYKCFEEHKQKIKQLEQRMKISAIFSICCNKQA